MIIKFENKLSVSLLRSCYLGCHAPILPTNSCSLERHIPFPLLLRTNNMHELASSPQITFLVTIAALTRFPKNGSLLLIGQFGERNVELE